jgi:hypothetical protein
MSAVAGFAGLEWRVGQLDHGLRYAPGVGVPAEDLAHFISVLQQIVPPGRFPDAAEAETVAADEADRWQRRCELLGRVAAQAPGLVDGPVDLGAQYWIAMGDRPGTPRRGPRPQESDFVAVAAGPDPRTAAKPFGVGLFSSTGFAGGPGMWRLYLAGYEGSTLHPMPWRTWRLRTRSDARVYEVSDAARWVRLITDFPRAAKGYVHPDWAAVAAVYDAVHVTLRAVTAAQGLSFGTEHGPTVPAYWDVEQTFWLRWCFDGAELVDVVKAPSAGRTPGTAPDRTW